MLLQLRESADRAETPRTPNRGVDSRLQGPIAVEVFSKESYTVRHSPDSRLLKLRDLRSVRSRHLSVLGGVLLQFESELQIDQRVWEYPA